MRRLLNPLGIVVLALLLVSCTETRPTSTPAPTPSSPAPVEASTTYLAPDPMSSLRFKTLTVADGLSQNTVRTFLQDRQGFLWFGTEDGLDRYDGYQFKIFRPLSENKIGGLSDRWITTLFEDRQGYLWVGTRQGGLNKYDPLSERFTSYRHDTPASSTLASDNVRCILQDAQGMIWIGTSDGLDRLDPQTDAIEHFRSVANDPASLSGNIITALLLDKAGRLWVGTGDAGLNQFEPSSGAFRHFHNNAEVETSLDSNNILALQAAPDGSLWVATSGGLNRLDSQSGQVERYKVTTQPAGSQAQPRISALYVDRGGDLWVGTNSGLYLYADESGKFTSYTHIDSLANTLNNNLIVSIYEDREGVLWVGTFGGGINKYNRSQDKFRYYRQNPQDPNSLGSDLVFDFYAEPSGVTWIATVEGLDRFDPAAGRFTHFHHDPAAPGSLSSDLVWAVTRDRLGKLWVGTQAGLDSLDEEHGSFTHYQHNPQDPNSLAGNSVYTIYEDKAGELWVGTGQGLDRLDRRTGGFIHYQDPANPSEVTRDAVVAIQEDLDHRLWVGTFNSGLFRLDSTRQGFAYYPADYQPGSLSSNTVLAINQDHNGNLWIATGGGLNKYGAESDSFLVYTVKDGLPNDVVYAVIEDQQGYLWLSTNYGISRFDPGQGTFRNYAASDGLQGNEFNQGASLLGPYGDIYFGGVNGFNVFDPRRVSDSTYLPPVILTALTLNGKPLETTAAVWSLDVITLEWPQDSFEFDFTALSFAEPQENQFAYKLDGLDSAWNEIGSKRNGRYTNLPGGNYTLRLKASNSDGFWNETGKTLQVTVIAPFWKTGWFYALLGLAALGAVVIIYRLRMRNIEAQKRELERLVNARAYEIEQLFEQNKELAVIAERNRLARELHDSAKQKAFASLAQLGAARSLLSNNIGAARKHLGEAENLVSEVIQELTFLIQEMYPIALKEKGLPNVLREYIFEWETRTDIRVNLQIEGEAHLGLEIEQAVFRIVQESLANIARHSQATRVEFNVVYRADGIEVCISDNGCGFDLEQKPNGIGLRSMRERAKSVGGTVDIQSSPGMGTQVTVKVPAPLLESSNGGRNG